MYKITINNLIFDAILGLLECEREKPQRVVVDMELKYNYTKDRYIDYAKVAEVVKSTIITKKFLLVEEALETLISKLKREFPQSKEIKLKISKPNILKDCIVGVEIKKNFKKN